MHRQRAESYYNQLEVKEESKTVCLQMANADKGTQRETALAAETQSNWELAKIICHLHGYATDHILVGTPTLVICQQVGFH